MKQETRRGLTKIALALALAGYCAVPAIAANESGGNLKSGQWVILSDSTGTLQGTVPGLTVARRKPLQRIKTTLQ